MSSPDFPFTLTKQMKQVLVLLLFFVVISVAALGVDINEVRKNAIKRLELQTNEIKKLAEDTSIEVDKRTGNIKVMTKHTREFGDGLIEKTNFEIKYYVKTFYMMANLLGSPNDVFRCIESCERDSLADSDNYYSQKFLSPGRDYETRAQSHQRDLLKAWKDNYYKSIDEYGAIYKRSVSDIQKSSSETSINAIVKQFEQTTKQMSNIITDIYKPLVSLHIQILRSLDQLVGSLENYGRYRVDDTVKTLQKCFPSVVQEEPLTKPIIY